MATPTSKFTGQIAPLCDHGSPPFRTRSSVSGFRNDSKTETGRRPHQRPRARSTLAITPKRGSLPTAWLGPSKARQPSRQGSFPGSTRRFRSAFQRGPRLRWVGFKTISSGRGPSMTPIAVRQPSVKQNQANLIELSPLEPDGNGLTGHRTLALCLSMILPKNRDTLFRIMLSLRGGRLH
jgi:hypothetical protein